MLFTQEELERYNRNILLSGVGEEGQQKLKNAKVLVVGAGGLGSPVLFYLAAAGIGEIGICDGDNVDLSNLQRQILHTTKDLEKNKALSAKEKLESLNPKIKINIYKERLNVSNILGIIKDYDLVIEATDAFASKFLLNDACVLGGKILVRASALHFCGQAMSIKPKESACYACLFDSPPQGEVPTGASVGILGAVAGLFGCIEANEAIKIITGVGKPLFDQFLTCDVRDMEFRKINIKRNLKCRVCGENGIKSLDLDRYQ
ncbi:HesA/MoeB/ThiF family protein [Helicobacter sp. 14348-15]|uniref:HesA/MoeB/ThiF family protein n=1 Tax=Helicobacter TaxID=209 RepID=UPI00202A6548|nr:MULTISPECIES: HesA/MoeB/ThiF family protein [Helicobacter]MCL9821629.1 HesA/MoeB/ThiF family protein [Helicobacter colisuis]MCL9823269.1 HesA/MoeB/ThiF family protein [Helicobacter colisuis]MDY5616416.1 HesA/MoeB/ThiF family protein [Helicobacter sp.]